MAGTTDEKRKLDADREMVKRLIPTGALLAMLIFVIGLNTLPPGTKTEFPSQADKLVYTLQWQTFSLLTLLLGIMRIASVRRATKAIDPIQGKGEHLLTIEHKYLQNTLEQLSLSISGQLILSTYLSAEYLTRVIPSLVASFVIARVLFYVGYKMDPVKRAVGFSMTFITNIIMFLYCTICFVFPNVRI